MPNFTYPIVKNGLIVPVLVGLDGKTTTDLAVAGLPIALPVSVDGIIDTGSNYSCASLWIFQQLGISPLWKTTTQTAGGVVEVGVYSVSIAIRDHLKTGTPDLTIPTIYISELPTDLEDADVLIGLNVLLECNLLLEGPAKTFSLIF